MSLAIKFLAALSLVILAGHSVRGDVKSVAILFRHGQRTPTAEFPNYWTQLAREMGYGQLTEEGSRQLWDLGVMMRARYLPLFPAGGHFRLSNMRIMSSVPERCIQSLTSFMAGFFPPPMQVRNLPIRWQPVPFTVDNEGKVLYFSFESCPKFGLEVMELMKSMPSDVLSWLQQDKPILDKLSAIVGASMDDFINIFTLADAIRTNTFLEGATPPSWALNAYHGTLYKYLVRFFGLLHENRFMKTVRGGPMLTEIVDNMLAVRANNGTGLNFLVYSAHDMTVTSLAAVLGIEDQIPEIASYSDSIAVEMHQTAGNGKEPEVKVFYFDHGAATRRTIAVSVPGCGTPCRLTSFVNAVNQYYVEDYDGLCSV